MPQNNESPHRGLALENWQENLVEGKKPKDLDTIAWEVIYFSREARKGPLQNRINPVAVSLEKFYIDLVKTNSDLATDIATAAIYKWAEKDSPSIEIWTKSNPPASEEILEAMYSFRDFCPGSLMAWISPRGNIYTEARINIYQTIKVNGAKYVFFWSIPSQHSDKECLEFSHKLLPYIPENKMNYFTDDVEELRINPLPLTVPNINSLTRFLNDKIYFPEVWQAIANGHPIIETLLELPDGRDLVQKRHQMILSAKTEIQRKRVGAELEIAIQERFQIELRGDAHGGLYSSDLSTTLFSGLDILQGNKSLTDNLTEKDETKYEHCGGCGQHGTFTAKKGQAVCKNAKRVG